MVRLSERRREYLAEKCGDLANLAIAALLFGQAVGQERFSSALGFAGIALWLLFMAFGTALKGDRR